MMRECWYYDPEKTKEQMRDIAAAKMAERKKRKGQKKTGDAKSEKVGKCAEVKCGCDSGTWEITEAEVIKKVH